MRIKNGLSNGSLINLRGIFLVSSGIILLMVKDSLTINIMLFFGLFTLFAGILGIAFTTINKIRETGRGWLIIESYADIIFSIVSLFIFMGTGNPLSDFYLLYSFFCFFLFFQKIVNIFRILQLGLTLNSGIIFTRVVLALGFGVSGFIAITAGQIASMNLLKLIAAGPMISGSLLLFMGDKLYFAQRNPDYSDSSESLRN